MVLALMAVLTSAAITVAVVLLILRGANRLGLIQHAIGRSSHTKPTPTGGGLGIVVGTIAGGVLITPADDFILLVLGIALVIALVGLADDRWSLPASLRLAVQLVAVILLVALSRAPAVQLGNPGTLVAGGAMVFAGLWWINLFNFLDGIDGYAGTEAVFVLLAALGLAAAANQEVLGQPLFWLMLATAASSTAFLFLNWPPAKIFMGDIGSTFLGFLLFAYAVLTINAAWLSVWQWAIMVALFVTDASVTLLRRLLQGERIMQAHRSHAYQRLSREWGGHRPVTMVMILANICVILPIAWAAGNWPNAAGIIAAGTYVALGICNFLLGAGKQD